MTRFQITIPPMPSGYGEAILPLTACKRYIGNDSDYTTDDDLLPALRDAAIGMVEQHCELFLGPRLNVQVRVAALFGCAAPRIPLAGPAASITSLQWIDNVGVATAGELTQFSVWADTLTMPIGSVWPQGAALAVITYAAGYAANAAPSDLLQAAKMIMAEFYERREAAQDIRSDVGLTGVAAILCSPYRRMAA